MWIITQHGTAINLATISELVLGSIARSIGSNPDTICNQYVILAVPINPDIDPTPIAYVPTEAVGYNLIRQIVQEMCGWDWKHRNIQGEEKDNDSTS